MDDKFDEYILESFARFGAERPATGFMTLCARIALKNSVLSNINIASPTTIHVSSFAKRMQGL
jgi:hypothetical protein